MMQDVEPLLDVADQQALEAELARLKASFDKLNKEFGDFAYIVSHDLKAPLRGVKTIVEWIAADYSEALDEEGREQLAMLVNRVERMHNLIEGVLQYSRIGRIKEEIEAVDLNEAVAEVLDQQERPAAVQITVQPDLPVVQAEPARIRQAFVHLIDNAVKFMDKPDGRVHVACEDDGDFWRFSVSDNGPGIEAQHFEKIFRMFQTLVPRDERESTGVGLTLARKIVELNGGRIWLESEAGKGTTFYFTYPKELPKGAPSVGSA